MSLVAGIALAIEAVGSVLLLGYVGAALLALARQRELERCRLLLADGAVFSLGFKTAASLLKMLELNTWRQVGAFVAVLALRIVLKRAFCREGVLGAQHVQRGIEDWPLLETRRPEVLFITGYTENAVVSSGHLDPGLQVLTKPFAIEALASQIKDLISD